LSTGLPVYFGNLTEYNRVRTIVPARTSGLSSLRVDREAPENTVGLLLGPPWLFLLRKRIVGAVLSLLLEKTINIPIFLLIVFL
jgi:hypothetical protein